MKKVVIITGGAGALGGMMATHLAEKHHVAILGRSKSSLLAKANEIQSVGGSVLTVVGDVLEKQTLLSAKQKILKKWGRIDILINAAGGNRAGATIGPDQSFFDLSVVDFQSVLALNLTGTVLPSLVFGEEIAKKKEGSIINISSMAAQQPLTRVVGYAASKAGIDNFTRWLAVELAQKYGEKVRVNAIAPGFFIGEQNKKLLLKDDGSLTARGKTIIDHTPMGRFGEPEELLGVLDWLCGEDSSFVTGAVIPIDGGFSAFSGV